jgi:predicted phosphodiesterase
LPPVHAPQIAVEGCCHGELDKIYDTLQLLQQREGRKVDLLICCGDFQVGGDALMWRWGAAAMSLAWR